MRGKLRYGCYLIFATIILVSVTTAAEEGTPIYKQIGFLAPYNTSSIALLTPIEMIYIIGGVGCIDDGGKVGKMCNSPYMLAWCSPISCSITRPYERTPYEVIGCGETSLPTHCERTGQMLACKEVYYKPFPPCIYVDYVDTYYEPGCYDYEQ